MRALFLLSVLFISVACLNDDDWMSNNGGTTIGGEQASTCADANYQDWQDSYYVLPYPVGKSYSVTLNHCSNSFHAEGQPDQFAIDFNMGIGETVTAARSGLVVHVEESGEDGGFPNNLVVVQHADGTFAQYMHLTKDGAVVETGQNVVQGTVLGYSGNTGLAGFPHLHFVTTAAGSSAWPYSSIPHNFKNTIANPTGPDIGVSYEALPY